VSRGDNYKEVSQEVATIFHPTLVFAGSNNHSQIPAIDSKLVHSKENIFLCSGNICSKPISSVLELLAVLGLLKQKKLEGK